MSVSTDDRFAPPQAHVEDLADPEASGQLAGRGTRLVAAIVDGLILAAIIWTLSWFIKPLGALLAPSTASPFASFRLVPALIGFLLFAVVQGWTLVTRGQTLAKMIFKLRIVRTDGSKADGVRLLVLRYGPGSVAAINPVLSMVYSLLDCLLIFRDSRQCLHDTIADTKVIKL
ncbi:RDD family protein [Roseateles sp.]|uniref:RDD family protein n=1 Tax=Roseateles sp. TaxID=1971397 RepID=UPI0031DF819A